MASEIKTRIARKDIKAIDKAATIAQHMKHSSVQIKERAEQTQEQREHSPVEYAQGRIADNAERVSRGAAAQVKNQSGKAVKHVKEKQRLKREEKQIRKELREGRIPEQGERPSFSPSGGEKGYQPKEQMIKTAQSQAARKRAAENSRKHLQKKTAQIVRTVERRERVRSIKYPNAIETGICNTFSILKFFRRINNCSNMRKILNMIVKFPRVNG